MTQPTAVILNDTATRYHHGCARVMRLLANGLEAQGFEITARSPARHDWARDARILAAMREAQVIVINGEGTLHDGAEAGEKLLSVMGHASRGETPVALVNALYENNPEEWSEKLAAMALVAARDSKSAAAMSAVLDRPVRWLPDLSLSAPAEIDQGPRNGLIVGDSVRMDRRTELARAAQRLDATYVPMKTLTNPVWRMEMARRLLWRGYNGVWTGSVPLFEMAMDEAAYLNLVAGAEGHITGRFHGVCLSILAGTPFHALASTTSKIETLLTDCGLPRDRLLTDAGLAKLSGAEARRPFSAAEREAVAATLERAATDWAQLFADIRALA